MVGNYKKGLPLFIYPGEPPETKLDLYINFSKVLDNKSYFHFDIAKYDIEGNLISVNPLTNQLSFCLDIVEET